MMIYRSVTAIATTAALSILTNAKLATAQDAPATRADPALAPLFPFVLPWDDASDNVTNVSNLLDAPAGKHGHIVVRGDKLFAGDKRQKFFGVNMAFGANFPTHEDGEKVAARLARFGVNCVRFHHMDMFSAPTGIMANDMRSLDAGSLDRMDHFVAALKKHGVYANINLHVSRKYPDMPAWPDAPGFDKGVDNFYPPMIDQQRDYARRLLTHVNPYTTLSYAQDPAVAIVEINNENGLIGQWWNGALDAMPPAYADDLKAKWNAWLGKKYVDEAALRAAWGVGEEKLGEEILRNGDFADGGRNWLLEAHGTSKANAAKANDGEGVTITVSRAGDQSWHVQFGQPQLKVSTGATYTVKLTGVKADKPRTISLALSQAHEPWAQLASVELPLTTTATDHTLVLVPNASDDNARLIFSPLGSAAATYTIGSVSLKAGGRVGLPNDATFGAIDLAQKKTLGGQTPAAVRDWMAFLWETESNYWTSKQSFLKDDLGVKALIIGSATGFSPPAIQAQLDVVDGHAYWQHPHFPGRSWDPANWVVGNESMAGVGNGGSLAHVATRRVFGKPYLVTEYNTAAPNTYGSETFLIANAYAAMQDWDGIFPFAYSHRTDDWRAGKISGFFDVDQHPTKMATFPVAAMMLLRGDVSTTDERVVADVSPEQAIDQATRSGSWANTEALGVPARMMLEYPIGMRVTDSPDKVLRTFQQASPDGRIESRTKELTWDNAAKRMLVDAPRVKAYVGRTTTTGTQLGDVTFTLGPNRQNWAAVTVTAIDGENFTAPGRLLITATGYAENTDMGWRNADKTTVGRDWGKSPSLVEGINGSITLPVQAARVVGVYPLDERGNRREPILCATFADGKAAVLISADHKTIWYEVEIK